LVLRGHHITQCDTIGLKSEYIFKQERPYLVKIK
jgi:hypothetical protein